jgi:Tfp pilus assembly pilus retraction ATPase PilT
VSAQLFQVDHSGATELVIATASRSWRGSQIASFTQSSAGDGMQGMDVALERLVSTGTISARDALDKETFAKLPSVARGLGPEATLTP